MSKLIVIHIINARENTYCHFLIAFNKILYHSIHMLFGHFNCVFACPTTLSPTIFRFGKVLLLQVLIGKLCRPRPDCSWGAVWSGSTQFTQTPLSHYLGFLQVCVKRVKVQCSWELFGLPQFFVCEWVIFLNQCLYFPNLDGSSLV